MSVVIKAVAFANGKPCPIAGQYVQEFDPDASDGRGFVQFTIDPARAKRFSSNVEALEFWRMPSTVKPLRDDGHPNRPLTSTMVELQVVK